MAGRIKALIGVFSLDAQHRPLTVSSGFSIHLLQSDSRQAGKDNLS